MEEPKQVLVIEDDAVLRELLADWLQAAGYGVATAPEGATGIAEARAHRPALVVTDINMPGMGGTTVISELKRLYPGLPVIAISAHFRSNHGLEAEEALRLGASLTLAKPFKRREMVDAVTRLAGPAAS